MIVVKENKKDDFWIATEEILKFRDGNHVLPTLRKFRQKNWGFVNKTNVKK